MTLDETIRSRRSIRTFNAAKPVDDDTLNAVMEAGRLAPSARNEQRWHFAMVRSAALRTELMAACAGQKMVGEAPVTMVVWAENDRMMMCNQSTASVDCSIAFSFMMLKATDLGLGTCWIGSFDADAVARILALPEGAVVVAVSPLGWPDEAPDARPRKALDEMAEIRD